MYSPDELANIRAELANESYSDNEVGTGTIRDACPNCANHSAGSVLCPPCWYDTIVAAMGGSRNIGPVRVDRPFFTHTCLSCGSRYMSDLVMSPAANQHMCRNSDMYGIWDESGYYDSWDEPEVPGIHFTHGDKTDNYDMAAHIAYEQDTDTYFGHILPEFLR